MTKKKQAERSRSLRLPIEMDRHLERYAKESGLSFSDVVRSMIAYCINTNAPLNSATANEAMSLMQARYDILGAIEETKEVLAAVRQLTAENKVMGRISMTLAGKLVDPEKPVPSADDVAALAKRQIDATK